MLQIVFLFLFTLISAYYLFLVWCRYDKVQARLLRRNIKYARSGWPFARWAYRWVSTPSYKWFIRIVTLGMFFIILLSLFCVSWQWAGEQCVNNVELSCFSLILEFIGNKVQTHIWGYLGSYMPISPPNMAAKLIPDNVF